MQSGNKSDGDDEAEAESSSSSSSINSTTDTTATRMDNMANEFQSVLDEFRDNWQKELKPDEKPSNMNPSLNHSLSVDNTPEEVQAETFFKRAVELEQRGKVYDALQYYRRAVQLDPDIEFKAYEASKIPQHVENEANNNNNFVGSTGKGDTEPKEEINEDEFEEGDLFARFQNAVAKQGRLIMSNRDAGVISTEMHISDLPTEILLYILRWVVSNQLDMRSLEQCAAVCKGFYLCARDEEIWRQACLKVWGVNLECSSGTPYDSYRQMFTERERVHFNGCYISKTTYLRLGENSFQDQFYRPVQMVEYYRYIRFLPDGSVLMMTSSDEPAQGVTRLKNLNQLRSEVLRGHYRLHGDTVTVMLKKNQRLPKGDHYYGGGKRRGSVAQIADYEANFTTYYIEFNITSTPKKRFNQLQWKNYSIILVRNKREVSSDFELTPSKYPPLRFSCVRSYHLDAEVPLQ